MPTRRLIVATPEGERELLFVGRIVAGRAPECDISLVDTKVSRQHAEFDATGPTPRVRDMGSRNGILVNGRKVDAADLAPGDIVTVGDARVRLEERVSQTPKRDPMSSTDDRTAVLPPAGMAPSPPREPAEAESAPSDADQAPVPASAAVVLDSEGPTAVLPAPSAPPPVDPPAGREGAPAPVEAPVASGSPVPVVPAPVATPPVPAASGPAPAAASGAVAGAPAGQAALRGPRMSWGGFLVIACLLLASTGVLLGALPLLSATSTSIDALGRRQARTLAGWLASAVRPDGADAAIVDAVLSQPGVESAMLLDASTGRAVAPAQMAGRQVDVLPLVGADWRTLRVAMVEPAGAAYEAIVPAGGPGVPHVAWVRYERGGSGEGGLAVVVALGSTIALALLTSILIRRHTGATLQHFTRQVELAVSGANAKVMRGDLVPGLDRLPGVVTYLLERRTDAAPGAPAPVAGATPSAPDRPASPVAPAEAAPWIVVTPALAVTSGQGSLLAAGPDAAGLAGQHLLDVLTDAPLRNAVVQGLGALGAAPGAEVTVPTHGHGTFTLSRQAGGNVRVARLVR